MTTSEHADLIAEARAAYAEYHDAEEGGELLSLVMRLRAALESAVLASTPSPTQPTEASEREALVRLVGSAVYGEPENLSRATEAADAILAAGFRLAPSPVVIHVGDQDDRIRAHNEGFDEAMAQTLADDPTAAYEWLARREQAARLEVIAAVATWSADDDGAMHAGLSDVLAPFADLAPSPVQGADDRLAYDEALMLAVDRYLDDSINVYDLAEEAEMWRKADRNQQSPQAALNEVRAQTLLDEAEEWGDATTAIFSPAYVKRHLRARAAELRAAPQTGDVEA